MGGISVVVVVTVVVGVPMIVVVVSSETGCSTQPENRIMTIKLTINKSFFIINLSNFHYFNVDFLDFADPIDYFFFSKLPFAKQTIPSIQ